MFNVQRDYFTESVKGVDIPTLETESVMTVFVDGIDIEDEVIGIKDAPRSRTAKKSDGWLEHARRTAKDATKSKFSCHRYVTMAGD